MMRGINMGILRKIVRRSLAVAMLGCIAGGCGGSGDPNAVEVSGTITFAGQPLPSGSINFFREGASGSAAIDGRGRYTMSLPPGNYQVSIRASEGYPPMGEGGQVILPKSLIPEKYGDVATSGLRATVEKSQSEVDFDLAP